MYRYRIQKQVLPVGAAADLDCFSGTSLLFSRILAPFFHVPSSLSSHLNSFQLVLAHLTLVVLVQVLFQPSRMTQLQTFFDDSIELPFHWVMVIL